MDAVDPDSRPIRDDDYVAVMQAYGRLMQASPGTSMSISDISAYHRAFELHYRLGWFVDALQLVQRVFASLRPASE